MSLVSTVDEVQDALVECHELWRRSPGEGRWPFAGDGPWHLGQAVAGDYAGEGQDGVSSSAAPRTPLDREEVDRRDSVTAWLGHLEPEERRMVWLGTRQLHLGEGRVPWKALAVWIKWDRTPDALRMRYRRCLALILCKLNGWPQRRIKALLAGETL